MEAGAHEKKGFMDKIKEKLPGHHWWAYVDSARRAV
jgi:hypothetical protein